MIDEGKIALAKSYGWNVRQDDISTIEFRVRIGNFDLSHRENVNDFFPDKADIEIKQITRDIAEDLVRQFFMRFDLLSENFIVR